MVVAIAVAAVGVVVRSVAVAAAAGAPAGIGGKGFFLGSQTGDLWCRRVGVLYFVCDFVVQESEQR